MIDDEMKHPYMIPYIAKDNSKKPISRRDYFAGLALSSFLEKNSFPINLHQMSEFCVDVADVLIKKLDENKNGQ